MTQDLLVTTARCDVAVNLSFGGAMCATVAASAPRLQVVPDDTVFADGEVDRSSCGSITCTRVALLVANGTLSPGQTLRHRSIIDSRFDSMIRNIVAGPPSPEVVVAVTGTAPRTGVHEFVLDINHSIQPGFVLQ